MADLFVYENRKKRIGLRIKDLRKKKSMTQTQLAGYISDLVPTDKEKGFGQSTISGWERGEQLPPLPKLIALSEIFQCDISYLLCDYDIEKKDIFDICTITGLSAAAVNTIVGDKSDGFRDIRIDALNFLLTSPNFENALHELSQFKRAEREAATFEAAKTKAISSIKDINEYHPNLSFLEAVSAKRQKATLCEYTLSKNFTFVIEELKRTVDKEVSTTANV